MAVSYYVWLDCLFCVFDLSLCCDVCIYASVPFVTVVNCCLVGEIKMNHECIDSSPNQLRLVPCPYPAIYHTQPTDGCLHRLTVGCQQDTTINIEHSCTRNSTYIYSILPKRL